MATGVAAKPGLMIVITATSEINDFEVKTVFVLIFWVCRIESRHQLEKNTHTSFKSPREGGK